MFLNALVKKNPKFISTVSNLYQQNKLEPDTYVIDLDTLLYNAELILKEARDQAMDILFITKQLGFNPLIAQELVRLGYEGAVCVDFKEAEAMIKNKIPIIHSGHLVQIPKCKIDKLVLHSKYITVFSLHKIKEINEVASRQNKIQNIFLRICGENDTFYPGQIGGFKLEELAVLISQVRNLQNIKIAGITSFPCFLYNSASKAIEATNNVKTLLVAKKLLSDLGIIIETLNMPSSICKNSIKIAKKSGATQVEVGHGVSGTTPLHAEDFSQPEIPAILYLSELSHQYGGVSYFYGGGYYRRGYLKNAILSSDISKGIFNDFKEVEQLDSTVIDYYFGLKSLENLSQGVITSFRTQMFITRSKIAIISGANDNDPKIQGIYDIFGKKIDS